MVSTEGRSWKESGETKVKQGVCSVRGTRIPKMIREKVLVTEDLKLDQLRRSTKSKN